jgi:hypothetical protein
MSLHRRSWLVKGVAAVAATAITLGATIDPPIAAGDPPAVQRHTTLVTLAAQSTIPLAVPVDSPALLTDWIERVIVPPSLGAPVPTPQFPPIVAPTSIGTSIKSIYNAVEPWVQYGFDLAAYAVGWVPYVGWLAPQITIFYHFGERIARSITFNIADWLDGQINFAQGLINVGVDTFNSFVQLGIDQWNFWLPSLPPLPPLPLSVSTPPAPSTVEPLTTPVDASGVAESEGNVGPKPKKDDEAARGRPAADEPPSVDPRDSISANESENTPDPSETTTAEPPRAERAESADRTPTTEAGAEDNSAKADGAKADGAKRDGAKADGPKDKKRNDE